MSKLLHKYKDYFPLILVLFIGLALRLYNSADLSFFNDEISALTRLNFPTFSELITKGIAIDTHPAGIQVFLFYWVKLFGDSVFILRLPFILLSTGAIALIFFIAKKWFNSNTAIFTALSLSVLQFPVFYGQLARPYAAGLFFTLLAVWYWSKIILDKPKIIHYIGFTIASIISCYIHYFSFLFVLIVGITGLFLLNKEKVKAYLLSALGVFVLFLPHVNITLGQIKMGGLGWLPPPDKDFLLQHIFYAFNESNIVLYTFSGISVASIIYFWKDIKQNKFRSISIIWFLLPILIGYLKSVYGKPVLQNSMLLFSLPYLLIFLFSFLPLQINSKLKYIGLSILLTISLWSLIIENKFYTTENFAPYKKIALQIMELSNQLGDKRIEKMFNIHHRNYIDYYFRRYNKTIDFEQSRFFKNQDLQDLQELIANSNKPYFLWSAINKTSPKGIATLIQKYYPIIAAQYPYFNATLNLYAKIDSHKIDSTYDFNFDKKTSNLFSKTIQKSLRELSAKQSSEILITCKSLLMDLNSEAVLVASLHRNNQQYYWQGIKLKDYILKPATYTSTYLLLNLKAQKIQPDDVLKIYIWNLGQKAVYIKDLKISVLGK